MKRLISLLCLIGLLTLPLQANAAGLQNTWSKVSAEEKNQLIKFLVPFSVANNFDVRGAQDADIIEFLHRARHDAPLVKEIAVDRKEITRMSKSGSGEWYFEAFSPAALNQVSQFYFGKSLRYQENSYAYFIDNYFYLPALEYGSLPETVSPQIYKYVNVGNGLVYVEYDNYSWLWEHEYQEIGTKMRDTVKDQWPKNSPVVYENYLESASGYALLKKTTINNKPVYRLVRSDTSGQKIDDAKLKKLAATIK